MEPSYPTLLVVDDTEDNLEFLEFALKRKPFNLLKASSGKECLRIAKEKKPDVILLDIHMPEMDGFETIQNLRADFSIASIPVIFLTAQRKDPKSIERGLELGADEFLTKTIDTEELVVRTQMLLKVKKLERELEKTKADFTAMLVHDLRSPLTGIKCVMDYFREIIEQSIPLNQEQVMLFNSVDESTSRMLSLINDILDISRLESGIINLDRQNVDLETVVNMIVRDFRLQFKKKDAVIELNLPANLPQVSVDINRMSQVIMNLLSNALKFVKVGGRVVINAALTNGKLCGGVEDTECVTVSVTDNGIGIPCDELPFVFDRYKQASTAKKSNPQGTGLGLAVCKLIVEAHGGRIYAESEEGVYTTFSFTIPKSHH